MKHPEFFSRILVFIGLLIILAGPIAAHGLGHKTGIEIHGRMAETGGWTPSTIRVQAGVPLHLRLTSDDVVHGFAVGQMDMQPVDILPGEITDLTITFDKPGTYTYYCTRWCGPNHWRMRGTIEVVGGGSSDAHPISSPSYVSLGLDIDAAHPAAVTPDQLPDAERGATFSAQLPRAYLARDYFRGHSPEGSFLDLRMEPALTTLTDSDIWDLVAFIWQTNTTPEGLAEGRELYSQNCAACHGETGGGDGVYSDDIHSLAQKTPAVFSDPASMLGASPALLQGKILRGGMGTGMPSWGPILTDRQTWNLVSYLYTFQFSMYKK